MGVDKNGQMIANKVGVYYWSWWGVWGFFVVKCLKKYGQEIDNIRCFKKKVL